MSDFDAIVIGSGMSGGWSAKELCERGLKVLVLERGRHIDPDTDYTDMLAPWERPNLDRIAEDEVEKHYPIQMEAVPYALYETTKHLWVKDDEHPYETPPDKPYNWIRGYHLGGRSIMWWRQSYRWSPQDFENNQRDGHGVDWPIRYEDLAPWYDHVERFAGISGSLEGLDNLPDGQFLPPFGLNCAEQFFKERVEAAFPTRKVIPGRTANLSEPTEEHLELGRGRCQVRSACYRGCSFGAYFSSLTATLPAAERTGNLTVITDAICSSLVYSPETGKVTGVRVIDANSKAGRTYTGRLIFLNASCIPSAMILLNSRSDDFPNGLANRSDQVGRNMMDHVGGAFAEGDVPGMEDRYYAGRRPTGLYIPRYANFTETNKPFVRGFGFQGASWRPGWSGDRPGIGAAFKRTNQMPGAWRLAIVAFGETLPNPDNRVTLHEIKKDRWGLPLPYLDCAVGNNERAMMRAASKDARAMLAVAGCTNIASSEDGELQIWKPGHAIHEMGSVRMGHDPTTSVLNRWNQAHDVSNLFVSDGACMTSSACQNPSLTYMALAARAANHAADLIAEGAI